MAEIINIADQARPKRRYRIAVPSDAPPPDRVRSLREVAQLANVSLATLRRLIKTGRGPRVVKISDRRSGVTDLDFLTWLEGRGK
jgi:predicted DNA-binding transcriptional regulator AlpA